MVLKVDLAFLPFTPQTHKISTRFFIFFNYNYDGEEVEPHHWIEKAELNFRFFKRLKNNLNNLNQNAFSTLNSSMISMELISVAVLFVCLFVCLFFCFSLLYILSLADERLELKKGTENNTQYRCKLKIWSAGYNSLTARALKRHLFNKKKLSLESRSENWDFEIVISSGDSATNSRVKNKPRLFSSCSSCCGPGTPE